MGFADTYITEWGDPIMTSKSDLVNLRDKYWDSALNGNIALGILLTAFTIATKWISLVTAFFVGTFAFLGGGTYLGNKFDNILTENNVENGIEIQYRVEFRGNAAMTEVYDSKLLDVRVA